MTSVGELLRSLRLTIVLFLVLACAAILGTLIPQNLDLQEYHRIYGNLAAQIFQLLHITDLYHSGWFFALMGALVLNLIACSVHRFPRAWKAVRAPQRPLTDRLWESLPVRRLLRAEQSPDQLLAGIREGLGRGWGSPREERVGEEIHLMARRGRYGRLGVFVTHLGVVVILLGATLGSTLGFKGSMQIPQGDALSRVRAQRGEAWLELPFQVRCDVFEMSSYPDGTPKEYRSDLSFLQGGAVALQGRLRVNHPMEFGGYVFYQSSYGSSAAVTLEAVGNPAEGARQVQLQLGETGTLDPEGKLLVRPLRYESNLQGRGPAVLLAYQRTGERPAGGWMWKGSPGSPMDGWSVRFVAVKERFWTGLQVKRDPGTGVVWIGCVLMLVGCGLAFFVPDRRIWVRLRREKGKTMGHVAASAGKGRQGLEEKVEGLCRAWEEKAGVRVMEGRGKHE
jgi:cytochrome c biogenesis protein